MTGEATGTVRKLASEVFNTSLSRGGCTSLIGGGGLVDQSVLNTSFLLCIVDWLVAALCILSWSSALLDSPHGCCSCSNMHRNDNAMVSCLARSGRVRHKAEIIVMLNQDHTLGKPRSSTISWHLSRHCSVIYWTVSRSCYRSQLAESQLISLSQADTGLSSLL